MQREGLGIGRVDVATGAAEAGGEEEAGRMIVWFSDLVYWNTGRHCRLVQQWAPCTRFALLDEPAVAPLRRLCSSPGRRG